ncbi:hypothetical protein [Burkholderia plantarii]|uniref:hypothetical protein n=1 Tax=Burkholderia plantarii TaxID=41899 RepID=UPI0018DBEAD5|nr:hypothetical protein [Burkholderia plantarii]MBI0325529.1 hypothetical protein [Burkholderia plantarii]
MSNVSKDLPAPAVRETHPASGFDRYRYFVIPVDWQSFSLMWSRDMNLAIRSQFILRSQLHFSLGARAAAPRFAPRRSVPATHGRRRTRAVPERPRAGL